MIAGGSYLSQRFGRFAPCASAINKNHQPPRQTKKSLNRKKSVRGFYMFGAETKPYSIVKSSATIQLLDIMNLHSGDRIAVIQQDEDVIGELITTTGLNKEVVVYGPNRWQIESLFNLSPVSSKPSWKTPRYVYKEDLKISSQYNYDKVLLNEVLQHNKSLKPMLRQVTSVLKMNDEVIVFEHIGDCCTHGSDCKEAKSSEGIERLFTSRSFRLIDRQEAGHYLLARFKYAPF
jgi:hypothetical protein